MSRIAGSQKNCALLCWRSAERMLGCSGGGSWLAAELLSTGAWKFCREAKFAPLSPASVSYSDAGSLLPSKSSVEVKLECEKSVCRCE
jgi:hypothetical protein